MSVGVQWPLYVLANIDTRGPEKAAVHGWVPSLAATLFIFNVFQDSVCDDGTTAPGFVVNGPLDAQFMFRQHQALDTHSL